MTTDPAGGASPVDCRVRPLLERLREAEADYTLTYGTGDLYGEAADHIEALKTVMVAAAEEIARHFDAHCDAEGYGPQNLLRRLEEGIPSQYGYTAGAFEQLRAQENGAREAYGVLVEQNASLRKQVDHLRGLLELAYGDIRRLSWRPNADVTGGRRPSGGQKC